MVVVGTPPERLGRFSRPLPITLAVDGTAVPTARTTTVVIATGQYLRGLDVVPRGHPGDGRLECQVYRLRPGERRAMRARLPQGAHIPHPRIAQRPGHLVEVQAEAPVAVEVDGEPRPPVRSLTVQLLPAAYRLLV
jgi:diacylglycerol kinase family enzyme